MHTLTWNGEWLDVWQTYEANAKHKMATAKVITFARCGRTSHVFYISHIAHVCTGIALSSRNGLVLPFLTINRAPSPDEERPRAGRISLPLGRQGDTAFADGRSERLPACARATIR